MLNRAHALLLACLLLLASHGWCHNEKEETDLQVSVARGGNDLILHYVTEFPSMSSFVWLKQLDSNGDGQYSADEQDAFLSKRLDDYLVKAQVSVDGKPVKLIPQSQKAEISGDTLGVRELSLDYVLTCQLPHPVGPGQSLIIKDPAFGWNRYRVEAPDGQTAQIDESSTGDTMTMTITFTGAGPSDAKTSGSAAVADDDDRLVSLLGSQMTPSVLLATLGLAFVLGALHALTPGHGKTMVAAYLVGSRGTISQAILLGLVVTITHTASVFLLGIGCMVAFQYVVPDKIIPWLGFTSGLMVTGVGATLLVARLSGRELGHGHSHDGAHGHSHGHSHSHSRPKAAVASEAEHGYRQAHSHDHSQGAHSHAHAPVANRLSPVALQPPTGPVIRVVPDAPAEEPPVSVWALVGLGISGGLVPCPEALVVLLAAISLNKLVLGMMVLVAFSAGLAALLVLIGILVVSATRMSKGFYPSDATIAKISMASYVFICGIGLVIAVRSLTSGGIITINL